MATQKPKRKLTAILSADVKDYSRLMAVDENGTVRTLRAHRDVMFNRITIHRGRVADSPGDNVLAEFASVVDAARCALGVRYVLEGSIQKSGNRLRVTAQLIDA